MTSSIAAASGQVGGQGGELTRLRTAQGRLAIDARLGLGLAAVGVVLLQPARGEVALALAVLLGYVASGALQRRLFATRLPEARRALPLWIDFLCCGLVIGASGGAASPLLLFMLFPIAVAALEHGSTLGLRAAVTCAALYAGMMLFPQQTAATAPSIAVVAMLLLGTLLAALLGRAGTGLMRRLALLNDVNNLFRPCSSVGPVVSRLAEMLRDAHAAESCLIMIREPGAGGWRRYAAPGHFTGPPDDSENARDRGETHSGDTEEADRLLLSDMCGSLQGQCYVSMPMKTQNRYIGRLFLVSRGYGFRRDEVRCLTEAVSQAALLIENLRLVQELASTVAHDERRRISRDLHDGAIQPYIGLKLGLEALRRSAPEGRFAQQLDELIKMATDSVQELRGYVGALKGEAALAQDQSLLPALRQQAQKFTRFYGIEAEVLADADITVNAPMQEEILNIVREGLANIRRHTSADKATVSLHAESGRLLLEFINDERTCRIEPELFFPKSIGERASELGGRVNVYRRDGGLTAVAVEIPL
jgi:signal transduction histidine kinase